MKRLLIVAMVLCFALPVGAQLRTGVRRQQGLPRQSDVTPGSPVTPITPGMSALTPENAKWNEPGSVVEKNFRSDVFAAPTFKFTTLNDQFGFLAGLRAGWIIKHTYVIGVAGYALVNDVPGTEVDGLHPDLSIKYGGAELEYILYPKDKVHFSFSTLVGIGHVQYDFTDTTNDDDDTFWVVEPSLTMYINLTKNLQTGIGLSYRATPTDVNLGELGNRHLSGLAGHLSFSFGTYGTTLIPD